MALKKIIANRAPAGPSTAPMRRITAESIATGVIATERVDLGGALSVYVPRATRATITPNAPMTVARSLYNIFHCGDCCFKKTHNLSSEAAYQEGTISK